MFNKAKLRWHTVLRQTKISELQMTYINRPGTLRVTTPFDQIDGKTVTHGSSSNDGDPELWIQK